MKKCIIPIALLLCLTLLAGCAGTTVVYSECTCGACDNVVIATKPTEQTFPVSEGAVKTGLAVIASVSGEDASADVAGKVSYDVTFAAVTVDDNGVIVSCVLDSLGTDITFDAHSTILSDLSATLRTKNELGEEYGMKLYAGSRYEWNEQAGAVAAFAVGKTVDELKNGGVTEAGYAKDADLASMATIYIGTYVSAIEKAVTLAKHLGAQADDTLKLASISSISASADGAPSLTCDVTAITQSGDTVTSCYLDSLQATVNVDASGTITSDLSATFQTKNELGEAYGMKAYAGSAFEWNEQAAAFASYVTGKTADEIAGIAVTEANKPADADLAAGVTIAIGGFQALLAKAMQP